MIIQHARLHRLRRAGRPAGRPRLHPAVDDSKGVWLGGETLLPTISSDLTPELQYVALDADRHLVLTSDNADYLESAVAGSDGGGAARGWTRWSDASGEPLSASVYDGDYTCSALAMSQADPSEQQQAAELVRTAGKVEPDRRLRDVGPARRARAGRHGLRERRPGPHQRRLARHARRAGPPPARAATSPTGSASGRSTADGSLVTMDLKPVPGAYVLSDLSSGPVLFATC